MPILFFYPILHCGSPTLLQEAPPPPPESYLAPKVRISVSTKTIEQVPEDPP